MNELSEFVKARRKDVNLTQEEFAARAGVALTVKNRTRQNQFKYGQGKPCIKHVRS